MIPEPWEFALLALAAFRLWKLIADDRILDRPRDWLLGKMEDERKTYWGDFLTCPWCAGFWISLLVYMGWIALGPGMYEQDDLFMGGVSVAAISGAVGMLGTGYFAIADE